MSKPILSLASRRVLCSVIDNPRPFAHSRTTFINETRLPLRERGTNGLSIRHASAAAATRVSEGYDADIDVGQHGGVEAVEEVKPETPMRTTSRATKSTDTDAQPSVSESPSGMTDPPSLPPSVVATITEKMYEWDQQQNARRERKQARRIDREDRDAIDKRIQAKMFRGGVPSRSKEPKAKKVEKEAKKREEGLTREERRKVRKEEKKAKRAKERALVREGLIELPTTARGEEEKSRLQIRTEKRLKKERQDSATADQDDQLSLIKQAVMTARKQPKPFSGSSATKDKAPGVKRENSLFSSPSPSRQNPTTPRAALRASKSARAPKTNTHSLPPDAPDWKVQKAALSRKFGDQGWAPRKKLSPDAQRGIRDLHAQNPVLYSTPVLAAEFGISAEAVRRILRSKWMDGLTNKEPEGAKGAPGMGGRNEGEKKMRELRERWAQRYDRIWDQKNQLGLLPARGRERRVEDREEGGRRVEEDLWKREVLERARREDPLGER